MNFLAHLYLSAGNPQLMVGNFIGDFVKGRSALEKFDAEIIRGIMLHRAIDEFTDTHPIVTQSKVRLRPKYRHYAGVIVDVFYDHFLARNWNHYHTAKLADFASDAYRTIESYNAILPAGVKHMLPYMIQGNWLIHYAETAGIHRTLSGMARRTPYESKMDEAVHDLIKDYNAFKNEFDNFFPALEAHAASFISP
jgi:acyl carrier protein phosphodiesterase